MTRRLLLMGSACLTAGLALWPRPALPHDTDSTTSVVFDREIVRILKNHCVSCHSEGNLAFPLTTYEEAFLRARAIKTAVQRRAMPPWSAMPGYGHFSNDNGLTPREIDFVVSWADGGKQRNAGTVFLNVSDPAAAVRRDVRAEANPGWQIPDLALTRLAAQTIPAGRPTVKRITIDPGLRAERWVKALEYLPGDRRVVRSAVFTLEQTGQWLGSWTPWAPAVKLPARMAYRFPAGARIAAEIHYQGVAADVVDEGTIGLSFGETPSKICESDLTLVASGEGRGAATEPMLLHAETTIGRDASLVALRPDVAAGVQSVQVSAKRADGRIDVLLFARDLRVEWPTPYRFKEPVPLRAGTQLSVEIHSTPGAAAPPAAPRVVVSRCS
jgi:mono/diheme cytochrome c family protein